MKRLDTEQMRQAAPTMFDAYNGDIKTTIGVLEQEADKCHDKWMQECLEATAEYLRAEVL